MKPSRLESCPGLCPWMVIGGLTPCSWSSLLCSEKKLPAILKIFFCGTDVPLIPFYSAKFLKTILRADIVTAFSNLWDKLDKIWRKSLEQIYNKLKIRKIHCHHPLPPPPHTHIHSTNTTTNTTIWKSS